MAVALTCLAPSCALRYGLARLRFGSLGEGDPVPDVALVDAQGEPLRLRELVQDKPLVLIFGSYT